MTAAKQLAVLIFRSLRSLMATILCKGVAVLLAGSGRYFGGKRWVSQLVTKVSTSGAMVVSMVVYSLG